MATSAKPAEASEGSSAYQVWLLVERVQLGDTEAFGDIYKRYARKVFKYVYSCIPDKQVAQDITSETFTRALKQIKSFTWKGTDFGAWLATIAHNLVADYFTSPYGRREMQYGSIVDLLLVADDPDTKPNALPETAAQQNITRTKLLAVIKQLTLEQQKCIILRDLLRFSSEQTAQIMGKAPSAISSLRNRALNTLYRLLTNEQPPPRS